MKKYSVSIFFSLLFILAFANANLIPVQSAVAASSIDKTENTGFTTHINYPESEIEYASIQGPTAFHSHYSVQKTNACPAANSTRIAVISSALYSPTVFEYKELFDNNYLSHNYPSHNFW